MVRGRTAEPSDAEREASPQDGLQQPVIFDATGFLAGLDALYASHEAATKAEPYLLQAMTDAENARNDAGLLTVLNETMGFYRSHGRHEDNQWIIQRALELGLRMGIQNSEAWTTTLINAATGMRAAGRAEQAEDLYHQALESAASTLKPTDRRLAALHNNLSMLYSDTGRPDKAIDELSQALTILETSSSDPDSDPDVASTHANLALALLERARSAGRSPDPALRGRDPADATLDGGGGKLAPSHARDVETASAHAEKALGIFRHGHLEHSAHFAAILASYAQTRLATERPAEAVEAYRRALAVIDECYGKDTDYHRITEANLQEAERAATTAPDTDGTRKRKAVIPDRDDRADASDGMDGDRSDPRTNPRTHRPLRRSISSVRGSETSMSSPRVRGALAPGAAAMPPDSRETARDITGMELSRRFWTTYGRPMLERRHPRYVSRIAAGLVGHGSECYGFDDRLSQDHDFGPGFCLWLTDEDYAAIGDELQRDYDALPATFLGFGPRTTTPRASGTGRRVGVFPIGGFFESLTGFRHAPGQDAPHEWLLLDEATLAAATNGRVFADPLGAFLSTRQGFTFMPEDVRLSLISRRLGMAAQAGQYNLPRMLGRDDGAAACLCLEEFVSAVMSLVFLINGPVTVGYLPYYKWRFAALRRLSRRPAARLADVGARLEDILRLSSAACFGGEGLGEGGGGSTPAIDRIRRSIEGVCAEIVRELRRDGLTDSDETFLEWQRPYVEEHIVSDAACLHSLTTASETGNGKADGGPSPADPARPNQAGRADA
ncbi:DUF4037 domain-containing protein [uncultured Bifidobacterium sp.]|uniref:DUF4037 domain-containing protein n=1 Tax=uncultured Bifidobacterium sp. TaxID=165187 RepID=UPI0037DC4099